MGTTKPACALMVHDVHEVAPDAQPARATAEANLSIPLDLILEVVEGLRSRDYRFLSLPEFVARRHDGGVALMTFDDGYRSLLRVAPRLAAEGVPALCFVVSSCLDAASDCFPLWLFQLRDHWQELDAAQRKALGDAPGVQAVALALGCETLNELLAEPASELYPAFYPRLGYAQLDALRELIEACAIPRATLDAREVVELHESGALAFGAHSVHHRVLPHLPSAEARREVTDSCRRIAELTGSESREIAFSYPYGQATPGTRRAVREHCLAGFVTAERTVSRLDPVELLPRVELDAGTLTRVDAATGSLAWLEIARERVDLYARVAREPLRRLKRGRT